MRRAGMWDGKTMESVRETDGETPELMLSDISDDGSDSDSDSEQAASASRKKKFNSSAPAIATMLRWHRE